MTDRTIDSLLEAIADRQSGALETLYHKTDKAVYAYALSILKNAYDAEDAMQNSYIKIFQSAQSYRSEGKPMAWILTIVRNLCLNILNENKKTLPLADADYIRTETNADDRLILSSCMELLDDMERQIVVLHAVAGFKHREIAQYLSIELSTVLSKYSRALKKMKRRVQE